MALQMGPQVLGKEEEDELNCSITSREYCLTVSRQGISTMPYSVFDQLIKKNKLQRVSSYSAHQEEKPKWKCTSPS